MAFSKLPIEPSVEAGNSFMFSLKARLRDIAKALNPIADVFGYIVPRQDPSAGGFTGLTIDATTPANSAFINLVKGGSGKTVAIAGYNGSALRWVEYLGDATAEAGSNSGSDFRLERFNDAGASLGTSVTIMRATGAMLRPNTPMFYASGSNAATAGTDVTWGSVQFNTGGAFNNTNGRFTAPHPGVYFFQAHVLGNAGIAGDVRLQLYLNGAAYAGCGGWSKKATSDYTSAFATGHISLNTGDYVNVRLQAAPEAIYAGDSLWSGFSGHLVG